MAAWSRGSVGVMQVEVIRSSRRRKTSSARLVDGVIEVRIPAWLSVDEESRTVAELVARLRRSHELAEGDADLDARARRLATRYQLPEPERVRWVGNQGRRWGSCTPTTGEIRISSRLRRVPRYVLDYVLLHELTHLVEDGHGPAFHALEARYPARERATGFLDALGLGLAAERFRAD